jgi:RimJ/RimL family protein N-acetyltransferase
MVERGQRIGNLVPLTPSDADLLAAWRNENKEWFFTEFGIDVERTRRWLADVSASEDRLLLGVLPEKDEMIGVVGLTRIDFQNRSSELDHILRGRSSHPGMMTTALKALLAWGYSQKLARFTLQVFADNPAIMFYRKLGFVELGAPRALRRTEQEGKVRWILSDDEGTRFQIEMLLPPVQLRQSAHTQVIRLRGSGSARN